MPMQRNSTGTTTTTSQDSPKSSRIAITMPPTIMIGMVTAIRQVIIASICTCWTSLVARVISEGAPYVVTSRLEKRADPAEHRGPQVATARHRRLAAEPRRRHRAGRLDQRDGEHDPTETDDVAGVALGDAVVDDVGVEARQVEHRDRRRELEDDDRRQPAAVRREVVPQESPEHHSSSRPSISLHRAVEHGVDDLLGGQGVAAGNLGWVPENVSSRSIRTTRPRAARGRSAPARSRRPGLQRPLHRSARPGSPGCSRRAGQARACASAGTRR